MQQTLSFEVALGFACILAPVVEIALGNDPKSADGGEHPTFPAVDLVHSIAFSHRPALTSARQVKVLREHIARVVNGHMIAFVAPAAAAAAPLAEVVAVAVI